MVSGKDLLSEEDFKEISKSNIVDLKEDKFQAQENLVTAYRNIIDSIKKYVDVNPIYHPVIACWIIGTYFHDEFRSYPFLFFNAMKGSGKTRTLNLVAALSKDGEVQSNMTEAVLFRTKGMLGIDEFEGITRRGNENLRELLNAAYKKGAKIKRMKKKRTAEGEEMVVEEFSVFRPICLANIWGMENVLGDRCISVVLEKSNNKKITRMVELFDLDNSILSTKELLNSDQCSLCSVVTPAQCYSRWNEYITNNYTTTLTNNYIKLHSFFDKIKDTDLDGRNLELSLPLLIIANAIGEEVFDSVLSSFLKIVDERKVDDIYNNKDVAIIDFLSQEIETDNFISITELTRKFKEFIGEGDEWINVRFVGRALERVKLILKKKRLANGIYVILDYKKAQERIKMFK